MSFEAKVEKRRVSDAPPFEPSVEDDDATDLGMTLGIHNQQRALLTSYIAKLGYKQELRRNFTMIEVFGIAFSIMGQLYFFDRISTRGSPSLLRWIDVADRQDFTYKDIQSVCSDHRFRLCRHVQSSTPF